MRRDFVSRDDLVGYLRAEFPAAAQVGQQVSTITGGRRAALERLADIQPARYTCADFSLSADSLLGSQSMRRHKPFDFV